jgi:hypothetical protein
MDLKITEKSRIVTPKPELNCVFVAKNHDEAILPSVLRQKPLDYNEVVDEPRTMNDSPEEIEIIDNLSSEFTLMSDVLIPFYGKDLIQKLFSKKWNHREEALIGAKSCVTQVFQDNDPRMAFNSTLSMLVLTIKEKIP